MPISTTINMNILHLVQQVDSQLQESITKDGGALSKAHVYRPVSC